MPGAASTYIIKEEQVRGQALGQILLDSGLLASQELSHDRLQTWRQGREQPKTTKLELRLEEGREMKGGSRRRNSGAERYCRGRSICPALKLGIFILILCGALL